MSRGVAVGVVLGGVLLVGGWLLWGAQGLPRETQTAAPTRMPRAPSRPQDLEPRPEAVSRNIFEFAADPGSVRVRDETPRPRSSPVPAPLSIGPLTPETPVEPAVRLVGVVLRGGQRKAALAIRGELAVIAAGETVDGYTVLAIDEEDGVRIKGPEGEFTLTPRGGIPDA